MADFGERSLRRRGWTTQGHTHTWQTTLQRNVLKETAPQAVSYGVCLQWGDRKTAPASPLQVATPPSVAWGNVG